MRPRLSPGQQETLTTYATSTRYPYPDRDDEISLVEARRAVALARRVRTVVRGHLPKNTLKTRQPKNK